jgi:hypothetical protein
MALELCMSVLCPCQVWPNEAGGAVLFRFDAAGRLAAIVQALPRHQQAREAAADASGVVGGR